jgi:hypothetical protein
MADPKVSDGARQERKAMRAYLRRQIRSNKTLPIDIAVYETVLDWVLARQMRYDHAKGGLGRTRKL